MAKRIDYSAIMTRRDDTHVDIQNPQGVPTTLLASDEVWIEQEGIAQALGFLELQDTVQDLYERQQQGHIKPLFGEQPALERVVLTPDFHRGGGIPVGTVAATRGFILPQAVGNDICCGMRLLVTDLTREDLERAESSLPEVLRGIFFEGKRQLPMSPAQREALLRDGLRGVHQTSADNAGSGIWRDYDSRVQERELGRVHFGGSLAARGIFAFEDYIQASGRKDGRDAHIGSVGGGNHFVELQVLEEIMDNHAAHAWGLKPGQVVIMVHSGSVGLGHRVGARFLEKTRALYPHTLQKPAHGFYPLPTQGPHQALYEEYVDAMRNAANFAFGNRLFLGLMAVMGLREACGKPVNPRLIYDAPHNLIWDEQAGGGERHVHRKGACPAYGPGSPHQTDEAFTYTGQPVIIPGSMGDDSYLLSGRGLEGALCSACHGAGRKLSRGAARHHWEDATRSLRKLRVVGPVDLESPVLKLRPDIRARYVERLHEEAPHSYKDVAPVIDTVVKAGVAAPAARLEPWLTIKGF